MTLTTVVAVLGAIIAISTLSVVLLLIAIRSDLRDIAAAIRERGPDLHVRLDK